MNRKCPHCKAQTRNVRKSGFFKRKSDSKKIQKYQCKLCKKYFSSATFSDCYHQNKRRINLSVYNSICSGMSLRRIAKVHNISRTTVDRKVSFLYKKYKKLNNEWIKNQKTKFTTIQFDDLETFEHTKCKPITVTVLVSDKRKIIDFGVSPIGAKGYLAKLSVKKYGFRKNLSGPMRNDLFKRVKPYISKYAEFSTDKHKYYPAVLKKHFSQSTHLQYKSSRACVTGQGELKSKAYDPLFKVNHTLAMLRDNLKRLSRRSWCTTKSITFLEKHLEMYQYYHNTVLTS